MNSKTIIRAPRSAEKPYFVTSRAAAQDASLSLQARGMLWYLLSKPDDWEIRISDLMRAGSCGRSRVYAILKELREHGYLVGRSKQRKSDGTFEWTEYQVIEEPNSDPAEPVEGEPCVENPDTENHHIIQNRENTKYTPNGVGATGASSAETPGGVESVHHGTEETNSGAGAVDGTIGGGGAGNGCHRANPPPAGSTGSRNGPRREKAGRSAAEGASGDRVAIRDEVIEVCKFSETARSDRETYGRAGRITRYLLGQPTKEHGVTYTIPHEHWRARPGDFLAFAQYWRNKYSNADVPRSLEKLHERWCEWREHQDQQRTRLQEQLGVSSPTLLAETLLYRNEVTA